jgi:16S rRNA (adenine1518-N6/adenine1519-N6)-dimethyltransferase
MKNIKAKKSLGQNFLIDPNILKKIVNEISPKSGDKIIEIGPGYGALTALLSESGAEIIAVEIDKSLAKNLKFQNVKILNTDFLKLNLAELAEQQKLRIVGNIPYNITSPIIFKLLEEREIIEDAVFLIQNEVAQRIKAKPFTKEYGILSVILQCFAEVKYCFKVSPNVFKPKPKVDSAVIHLYFQKHKPCTNEKLFIEVVKAAFSHRRKTLKNSLMNSIFKDCNFKNIDFDLNRRAEELSIKDYVYLTERIKELKHDGKRIEDTTARRNSG